MGPAAKKAYEITYALIRVAAILPSKSFAEILEKESLNFLAYRSEDCIERLAHLVSMGRDTGNIHPENADLLISQMESFLSMTVSGDSAAKAEAPRAELGDIFSERSNLRKQKESQANSDSAEIRQNRILEIVRQSGNCRTKEVQAEFPEVSERTLRYDLQRLIEEGKIEREGPGGPASWYTLKKDEVGNVPM